MFQVKTTYTKDNLLKLQKYHFYHQKPRIVFLIFGIIFIIFGLLGLIISDYEFTLLFFILGILLVIEYGTPIIPMLQINRLLKSDAISLGLENEFTFYEDHFEVVNKRSNSTVYYNELYCYKETKEYFYLYINKISAFIIEKEEHQEKVRKLLQENIKRK